MDHKQPNALAVIADATSRARRFQQDQLENAVGRAGARGLTADEIAHRLTWPSDSVSYWIERALDAGEITIAADEVNVGNPHYVTIANLCAIEQADGGAV